MAAEVGQEAISAFQIPATWTTVAARVETASMGPAGQI